MIAAGLLGGVYQRVSAEIEEAQERVEKEILGGVASWDRYQLLIGERRGLVAAQKLLTEGFKKLEDDDD